MELGGKSPLIICDDADLDRAADIAMMANFYSSGQVCTNGTACSSGLDESAFEAKIAERVARIALATRKTKTPTSARWSASPTWKACWATSPRAKKKVPACCGGERLTDGEFAKGAFVAPTVFTDCTDDMTIVKKKSSAR
jgi:betaine-aldehyde dehydrogenase